LIRSFAHLAGADPGFDVQHLWTGEIQLLEAQYPQRDQRIRFFVGLREVLAGPGTARPAAAVILVGPKGGWTAAEEKDIRAAGFEAVSLGSRILRAETAAVAAAAMALHFWGG
jgi:16S rRNA U1498 N3-methylase RsmE